MRFSYIGLDEPVSAVNKALFSYIKAFRHKDPILSPLNPSGVFASRTEDAALFAAYNEMAVYTSASDVIKRSDVLFCFLPDSSLRLLASDLRNHGISGKIFCHFSPAYNADVLDFGEQNTYASFFIPSYKKLPDKTLVPTSVFVEGYGPRYDEIFYVCQILGIEIREITKEDKLMYSAGAHLLSDIKSYVAQSGEKLLRKALASQGETGDRICSAIFDEDCILTSFDPLAHADAFANQVRLLSVSGYGNIASLYAGAVSSEAKSKNTSNAEKIKETAIREIKK